MLLRPRRQLEVLSISALDIFASALGVFVLMAVLLFPYYLKQPSLDAELDGARRQLAAAGAELESARQGAAEAKRAAERAAARREQARQALEQAEAELAAADRSRLDALREAEALDRRQDAVEQEMATLWVEKLDLVFVMDTTGSMRDEIADVQANMLGIVRLLYRLTQSLRVGFVSFKDVGEDYLTRVFELAPMGGRQLGEIQAFVGRLQAEGGGDTPEPVGIALERALAMRWRGDAEGRIIVIGDAPAHQGDWPAAFNMAQQFHGSLADPVLTRRVAAVFTGSNKPGRQFYERLAQAGAGDYVAHRGRMVESVLLSVLDPPSAMAQRER